MLTWVFVQRSMMVIEDYNGADASWSYSRCDKHAPVLPYGTYWPLVHAGAQSRGARLGQEEHLSHLVPNYGHTDCQRRLSLEALIHARARFRRGLERVLQVYLLYSARLRMLDRYYHELLRAAGSMREARSGRRHPMSVLQQLFGLAHGTTTHGNDARLDSLSTAILPEELLFNDTEEGCGVSYWLVELLRGLPLGDEALGECYQVRLGPVYVSLAQDMCRLPLYSNHSLTQLMEELVSAGASCTPPMATVLRSLSSQGPPLEHVLYASVPPGLQLRVSLSLLLDVCPATHPDQQHLRSALQHIDSTFAIAPLLNNLSQGSWELRCPSILGRLGAFFSMLESRFDAAKRNTISRGPVVQAHLELLAEAVDAIQAFCARLSRDLVDTLASSLDAPAPLPVHEVRGAAEADDTGWEFVARGLDNDDGPDSISQLVAIERSVNSVVLTRLWPTLEDLVSGVEREKDARIALGLPAFGWDQKGMANLLHHLAIPHFLLSQHTLAASDEKSSEELDQGVPVFYASCAEALGEMARAKTPHHKAAALAAASRAILLCLEHHFVNTQQSSSMDQVGSGGSNISVLTVLHKCLAFTVLSMAHQNHSSSFRRYP